MDIRQKIWRIKRLVECRKKININPIWQRGPAWKPARQVLLIDSILRGMDVPKIYLRRLAPGDAFRYDAVDGQQRLRAIWDFRAGNLALEHPESLPDIDGLPVATLKFDQIGATLQKRFDEFAVSVAEITSASNDEITNLFSRLQMGVSLNPAELRNAMLVPLRHMIDGISTSHAFFLNCRIPATRYKHQDYLTHAFAMAAYQGEQDIKARDLKQMLGAFGHAHTDRVLELSAQVGDALNVMTEINDLLEGRITQKWGFVDLAWLIMQRQAAGAVIDTTVLAANYDAFDKRRREYNSEPERLIRGRRRDPALDRHLYNYITAFRTQGGVKANLLIRNNALAAFCPNINRRS
jgi:hypothetical protein